MVTKGFGYRVREILEEKNISKEEFGERMKTSPRSVRRYTSEQKIPAEKTVKRIADALEVDADYLLAGLTSNRKKKTVVNDDSYKIAASIISEYSNTWDDKQKNNLMKILLTGEDKNHG